MNGGEFSFCDDVEAGLDDVVGKRSEDRAQHVIGQFLDVFGESETDGTVKLDVILHEGEQRLGADLVPMEGLKETEER